MLYLFFISHQLCDLNCEHRCILSYQQSAADFELLLVDARIVRKYIIFINGISLRYICKRISGNDLVHRFLFSARAESLDHFLFRKHVFQLGIGLFCFHIFDKDSFFDLGAFALARISVLYILQHVRRSLLVFNGPDLFTVDVYTVCLYIEVTHVRKTLEHLFGAVDLDIAQRGHTFERYIGRRVYHDVYILVFGQRTLHQIRDPQHIVLFLHEPERSAVVRVFIRSAVVEHARHSDYQHDED